MPCATDIPVAVFYIMGAIATEQLSYNLVIVVNVVYNAVFNVNFI